MALRVVALLLAVSVLLTGCVVVRSNEKAQPPVSAVIARVHGPHLVKYNVDKWRTPAGSKSPDSHAFANVTLANGTSTVQDAVAIISALRSNYPGYREYHVFYRLSHDKTALYLWSPDARTLMQGHGEWTGDMGLTTPQGTASGVTTSVIDAIAAGKVAVPAFR